jgi:hypothetical protein
MADAAQPTLDDVNNALAAVTQKPSLSDVNAALDAIAQNKSGSVTDAFSKNGISGAWNQLKTNASNIKNYQPDMSSDAIKERVKASGDAFANDPAIRVASMFGPTSGWKTLGGIVKSGAAKISGLIHTGDSIVPILEASEAAPEAASVAKDIESPFTKDIFSGGTKIAEEATPAAKASIAKEVFDPFTKTTKIIPAATGSMPSVATSSTAPLSPFTKDIFSGGSGGAQAEPIATKLAEETQNLAPEVKQAISHAADVAKEHGSTLTSKLLHTVHMGSPSIAGAYVGKKAAESVDAPEWLGEALGLAAGPAVASGAMKMGSSIIPIITSPLGRQVLGTTLSTHDIISKIPPAGGTNQPQIKGYSDGGEVADDSPPANPPPPIDPDAAADVQASMRKAFHFANGGQIPGAPNNKDKKLAWVSNGEIILPNEVTQSANAPEMAKQFVRNIQKGKQ